MSRTAFAVFAVAVSTFLLTTVSGATITSTVTAGPGLNLNATGTLNFWVSDPGLVTFTPGFSGNSPGCTPAGGCFFSINDRILLNAPGITDSAVISGSLPALPGDDIVTSTICSGPPQTGFTSCTNTFGRGMYSVSLQLSEILTLGNNATGVPGTRTLSITISGASVLASPEPGTLGLAGLALAGLYGWRRRSR